MKTQYFFIIFCFCLMSMNLSAQWETEELPDGRSEIASVAVGDNIYFVGGALSGTTRYFKMNIYNVPTQTWRTEDVPNGTKGTRTIAIGNKIYFGDIEGDRTLYVYDTDLENWDEIEVPGFISSLTHLDNKIIVASSGDVLIYDLDTEEWTDNDFGYNPSARVAAANGKIVLAGGNPNIARIYDVDTDIWTQGALSTERDEPVALAHENRIFFIGGEGPGFAWTGRIDIYDTETNTWSIDSLSRERNRFAATIHDDKLIVAGGQIYDFFGQFRQEVDILDLNTNTWETVFMPTGRRYPSVVGYGDKIYIAGGDNDQNNLNVVDIYNLTGTSTKDEEDINLNIYPIPSIDYIHVDSEISVNSMECIDINGQHIPVQFESLNN